jgi:hypothetical protein
MLDIDTAIKHCLEVAEQNDAQAEKWREEGGEEWGKTTACRECAAEHRQLAEWLTELKQWRRVYGVCPSYEMCILECKEGYNAQIAEYKRLLKLAVEDFETIESNLEYDEHCVIKTHSIRCDECPLSAATIYRCKWRHADEFLALIGEDGDTNG